MFSCGFPKRQGLTCTTVFSYTCFVQDSKKRPAEPVDQPAAAGPAAKQSKIDPVEVSAVEGALPIPEGGEFMNCASFEHQWYLTCGGCAQHVVDVLGARSLRHASRSLPNNGPKRSLQLHYQLKERRQDRGAKGVSDWKDCDH